MRVGFRQAWKLFTLIVVAGGIGCTTIPDQQFASYREAFQATRTEGEKVLADFAAAKEEAKQREKPKPGATPAETRGLNAALKLQPFSAQPARPGEDAVAVRLKAWQVTQTYNEALAALAAGVKQQVVESNVHGFVSALKNFPIEEVAKFGAGAAPYAQVVVALLETIEKEVRARQFKNGVLAAGPAMEKLIDLLLQDAEAFYSVRFALQREKYDNIAGDILDLQSRFRSILAAHSWTPVDEINTEVDKVNKLAEPVEGVRLFPAIVKITAGAEAPEQPADLRDAQLAATQMSDKVESLRSVLLEAKAYRAMMEQYAALITSFGQSQKQLTLAVENGSKQLPSLAQIQDVISNVRLAQQIYTSTR